jgi:acetyl-CoA acetyltransferase
MTSAWIVGTASTPFERHPERTHADLAISVVADALSDARLSGSDVQGVWFGNCAMHTWGQSNIRGQVALSSMFRSGALSPDAAVVNVEAACATGSATLAQAVAAVRAGATSALAVGVEKVFHPDDPTKTFGVFLSGADVARKQEWLGFVAAQAAEHGLPFTPHPHRVVFVDIHALQARWHMSTYGTTIEQIAAVAAKDHAHGARNPKAQYGSPTSAEAVLADKSVGIDGGFTRSMCSPVSDGAAAVVVVSDDGLQRLAPEVRARAVRVRACELTGGRWRGLDEPTVVHRGVQRGLAAAGITASDIDLAEVHDAASFCEIEAVEALGLCGQGEGGPFSASGATSLGGAVPVNVSGGLVSKGHPLAATGLGMVDELVLQLRGEAGERQVADATIGVAQNAGGLVALDEAVCGVTVLERR